MRMDISFSLLFFLLLSLSSSTAAVHHPPSSVSDLVRTSCVHASFPAVCIRTLSSYAGPANTPREVAQAAVKVSLSRATKAWDFLSTLLKTSSTSSGDRREKGALSDCVTQMSDSVDELRKTLNELKELRRGTFRWQMSNAETWVSAALTNEDTCLDGFKDVDGKVRSDVKRKITNVARVTSNALYLINRLDQGTRP